MAEWWLPLGELLSALPGKHVRGRLWDAPQWRPHEIPCSECHEEKPQRDRSGRCERRHPIPHCKGAAEDREDSHVE